MLTSVQQESSVLVSVGLSDWRASRCTHNRSAVCCLAPKLGLPALIQVNWQGGESRAGRRLAEGAARRRNCRDASFELRRDWARHIGNLNFVVKRGRAASQLLQMFAKYTSARDERNIQMIRNLVTIVKSLSKVRFRSRSTRVIKIRPAEQCTAFPAQADQRRGEADTSTKCWMLRLDTLFELWVELQRI